MPSSPLSSELTASLIDTKSGDRQGSVVLPSTNGENSQASDGVLKRDTSPSILVESPAAASASGGVLSAEVVPLNSSSSSPSRTNQSPNSNNSPRSRSLSPKQGPSATTIDSIVATSPSLSAASAVAPASSTLPQPNQSSRNSSQRQFSASRPSPVVPASVPGSPSFSRPNSPRPGLGREREKSDGEPPPHPTSPTRSSHHHPFSSQAGHGSTSAIATGSGSGSGGASLSRSGSAMDLSHIFERDVEFSGTHHISPQEAVDVAIPPVLSEAAVALLSPEGNLSSTEIASLVRESEATASSSGWDLPPTLPPSPLVQQHRFSALSSPSESTSPDSELFDGVHMAGTGGSGPLSAPAPPPHRRAASPRGSGSGSSKYLHTPSTSPPSSMSSSWAGIGGAPGAGGSSGGGGGGGTGDVLGSSAPTTSTARLSSSPGRGPTGMTTTTNTLSKSSPSPSSSPFLELQQGASLFGSNVSPASSGVFGENVHSGASAGGGVGGTTLDPTSVGSVSTPRRLSFLSYSDIINEERLAELQGSPIGGPQSIPVGGGIAGVSGGSGNIHHHQGSSSSTTNIINVGGGGAGGGALTPSRIASAATPLDLSSLMRSLEIQGSPHPGS